MNKFDLTKFIPIKFKKKKVGWLHQDNKHILPYFDESESYINIDRIMNYSKNVLDDIEIEHCPLFYYESIKPKVIFDHKRTFGSDKIYTIKRNHLSLFGFPAYGVHCNVWSKYKNSFIIHLAKRSTKLKNFPGLYDNLIAGGQPDGISIIDNLKKEAFEEAGLNAFYINPAVKGSNVHYMHNERKNFNSAIIFNYHLEKKSEMKFVNQDGEVDDFLSIDIENLYEILERGLLKPNCIIPILDFLIFKKGDFISKKVILEIRKILKKNET